MMQKRKLVRQVSILLLAICLLAQICPVEAFAEEVAGIATTEEMVELWNRGSFHGDIYLLNDIDMGGYPVSPLDLFGTFDGGGHTIFNLPVDGMRDEPCQSVGMFGAVGN